MKGNIRDLISRLIAELARQSKGEYFAVHVLLNQNSDNLMEINIILQFHYDFQDVWGQSFGELQGSYYKSGELQGDVRHLALTFCHLLNQSFPLLLSSSALGIL